MNFIPLNVKTCYSFLESPLKLKEYVLYAKKLGFNSLGICDYNPYAFAEFSSLCQENDIKPILGCRFYLRNNSNILEIDIFIQNEIGYKNFNHLYASSKDNFIILDDNIHIDGLVFVIPSSSNQFVQNESFILKLSKKIKPLFIGEECYSKSDGLFLDYVKEFALNNSLQTLPYPLTLALHKNDGLIIKILSAIKNNETLSSFEEINTPYFLLKDSTIKDIYLNDLTIFSFFNDFNFNLMKKRGSILHYDIANKKDYLFNLAKDNLTKKGLTRQNYISRLNYEIDVISSMGYLDYFLIVADYVNEAKKKNIPVGPGRGSACGSLFSYALNITEIDPLQYNLLFERFLNPERTTMPDIDVDFADYKRDEVISFIKEKYGKNKVRSIITFQRFLAKQALKDIGKVFSLNSSDINILCKELGNNSTFIEAEQSNAYQEYIKNNHYNVIINLAKKLEGLPRQKGIHASGIIINNDNLFDVLPLLDEDNSPVPFEASYLQRIGFLKMDILALRNLTLIEEMVDLIKKTEPNFDISNIPLDNQKAYEILNVGLTKDIFQLESNGITNALKIIHLETFSDLICLIALYRPGPIDNIKLYAERKNKHAPFTYINPILEPILKETNGIIVYQEQIMLIAQKVAMFSLGKADILRRAISEKNGSELLALKNDFIKGALSNNFKQEDAELLYNYIEKFASYGFNKSHSVSYSKITYQMAYIKANYPTIFFSTILNNQKSSSLEYFDIINELSYFNIKLLSPSINESTKNYRIQGNNLRIPLNQIKEISLNISLEILKEREKGKFTSFYDFVNRTRSINLTSTQKENLIDAGALDEFNYSRTSLKKAYKNYDMYFNNFSFLTDLSEEERNKLLPVIINEEDDIEIKNALEINSLGLLISRNLFTKYENYIKNHNIKTIKDIYQTDLPIYIIVKVNIIREITTKGNKLMAILNVIDNLNQLKVIIFPKLYDKIPSIKINDVIILKGYLKNDEHGSDFIAQEIKKMEEENE